MDNLCCDECQLGHATIDHYRTKPIKLQPYIPFIPTETERVELIALWHTSRVDSFDRFERMRYVAKWFRVNHPKLDCSHKALWLAIERITTV